MKLSVVIPIYNELEVLPLLCERLSEASEDWDESFEIVLVDDGSTDGSLDFMRAKVDEDPRFRVIRLSTNIPDNVKFELIREVGVVHVRNVEGCTSPLQLRGMCARLLLTAGISPWRTSK